MLFDRLDLAYEGDILGLRKHFFQVLGVLFFAQHLARHAVGLPGMFADKAIEFHVRDIKLCLTLGNTFVDHLNELNAFLAIEFPAVLIHALEVGLQCA